MALALYTIGDKALDNGRLPIFRVPLTGSNKGNASRFGGVALTNAVGLNPGNKVNVAFEDLEGIGFVNGRNQGIIAVSESDQDAVPSGSDGGVIVTRVEKPNLVGSLAQVRDFNPDFVRGTNNRRFGSDGGAGTVFVDGKDVLFNLNAEGGEGSSLYRINNTKTFANVRSRLIESNASAAAKDGTASVSNLFADGLTGVDTNGDGRNDILVASDLEGGSGSNYLYWNVPITGANAGRLEGAQRLDVLLGNGNPGNFDRDSGLGSAPASAGVSTNYQGANNSGDGIYALLESGTILHFDINLGAGTARVVEGINVPDIQDPFQNLDIDFEGAVVVDD